VNPFALLTESEKNILLATPAIQNSIREGKTHLIPNTIQTSGEIGMCTLENSLASWVKKGEISMETAQDYSIRPEDQTSSTVRWKYSSPTNAR